MLDALSNPSKLRYLWVIPGFLLLLTVHQIWTAYRVEGVARDGFERQAKVVRFELKSMAAQTHGVVVLSIPTETDTFQHTLSLPLAMARDIQGKESVTVRLDRDDPSNLVITELGTSQVNMAIANAAIAGLSTLLTALAIGGWIRYVRADSA